MRTGLIPNEPKRNQPVDDLEIETCLGKENARLLRATRMSNVFPGSAGAIHSG